MGENDDNSTELTTFATVFMPSEVSLHFVQRERFNYFTSAVEFVQIHRMVVKRPSSVTINVASREICTFFIFYPRITWNYAKGHLEVGGFVNLMEWVEYIGKEIVWR